MEIFSAAWWEAAGARAARTAVAALLPLAALLVSGETPVLYAASVTGVAVLGSFATSLFGLAEVQGKTVPLWRAVLTRTAKTLGQSLAAALVGVTLLNDVDWTAFAITVGGMTLTTLLTSLKDYLPEQEPVPGTDTGVVDSDVPVVVDDDPSAEFNETEGVPAPLDDETADLEVKQ